MALLVAFLGIIAATAALPTKVDPVIQKLGGEQRYQPMRDAQGVVHMVDTWLKVSNIQEALRYTPDTENVYHLFTRENPTTSQVMLYGNSALLSNNFNPSRRTIVIAHGWTESVLGALYSVLVPAFLAAEDVNVICADWSAGAGSINYMTAVRNTVPAGEAVARFINWLNAATGATPDQYHIVGHSLGGHMAGIIGRNLDGVAAYITALDPALPAWITNPDKFRADDGAYTEVIHTNAFLLGYYADLGQVDFYPNGGSGMAGCDTPTCDHDRCFHYLAESIVSGGFTSTNRCATYLGALTGNCILPGGLQMGGLTPKTGSTGIYYLETNAAPPFSQG